MSPKTQHSLARVLSLGLLAASLALAGCAGYRGGWESVAYVGDARWCRSIPRRG